MALKLPAHRAGLAGALPVKKDILAYHGASYKLYWIYDDTLKCIVLTTMYTYIHPMWIPCIHLRFGGGLRVSATGKYIVSDIDKL
jgi:hypothetical protein